MWEREEHSPVGSGNRLGKLRGVSSALQPRESRLHRQVAYKLPCKKLNYNPSTCPLCFLSEDRSILGFIFLQEGLFPLSYLGDYSLGTANRRHSLKGEGGLKHSLSPCLHFTNLFLVPSLQHQMTKSSD